MSGGSYNYLFTRDGEDLFNHIGHLRGMADRLAGLGYAEDAAAETEELLLILNQTGIRLNTRMARLQEIFRAVEWWDSNESGEQELKEALVKYREESKG